MPTLSKEEDELLSKLARTVVARGLTVPVILFLESTKPLAFLGSQSMHMLEPMVRTVYSGSAYRTVATLLEDRDSVEELLRRIEREEQRRETVVDTDSQDDTTDRESPRP